MVTSSPPTISEVDGGTAGRMAMAKEELRRVGVIAGPMIGVILMQYFLQLISVMMVGHTGTELSLSAATLAFSLATITGLSIHLGMAGGLETLGGQAYGAQQYQKLGILTYTAMFTQLLVSFPLALIWIFMDKLLLLLFQDAEISLEASKFTRWLIPTLFAYAVFQPLVRYFQMQCLIGPLLVSITIAFVIHIPVSWLLVYKTALASNGAALGFDISNWIFAIILGLFMRYSPKCAKTRAPFSTEMFAIMLSEIGPYLWLAVFSALMVCLEYWAFEIIVLLAGLLDDPELETSTLALCVNTLTALYTVPYGLGCGACTRISNELGSGNAKRVNVVIYTILLLAGVHGIVVGSTLFATRHIFGYVFSRDKQVVDYFATIAPLICCSVIVDGFICVLTGVSRGCGFQKIVTIINIIAYYFVGIPAATLLGFNFNLKGKGLWGGILLGEVVQLLALSVTIGCTNWDKQAIEAHKRVSRGKESTSQNGIHTNVESQTPIIIRGEQEQEQELEHLTLRF